MHRVWRPNGWPRGVSLSVELRSQIQFDAREIVFTLFIEAMTGFFNLHASGNAVGPQKSRQLSFAELALVVSERRQVNISLRKKMLDRRICVNTKQLLGATNLESFSL